MTGTLFTTPRFRAFNSSGQPLSGARLTFHRAGTSVLASTFTTSALTVEHPNPLTADYQGEFRAIYLDPNAGYNYRATLTTSAGVQIWSEDDIPATSGGSSGEPGEGTPGTPGLSVAELAIFLRSDDAPGTPTGGSFNFGTQALTPPAGWSVGIPAGTAPVWTSRTVASISGVTGTDSLLTWSSPVKALSDGSAVDIVFRRSDVQPPTPAPSPGVPADWYTDVGSVPASADLLWSSVGTRDHAGANWIWQLPIQVEGDEGAAGADASLWYIKPLSGTALKNGAGALTLEAHQVVGGTDTALSTGSIKLYVGSTEVTVANGYATGSTGYVGVFDAGDINNSVVVTMKNGPAGTVLDSITLVDIADGTTGGVGSDAVYGYIEGDGPLAWVRGNDGTTWTPSSTTLQLDCTFVQAGAEVARVAWLLTRDSDGILTGATTTHTGGDLNGSRVTVSEVNEGTSVMSVQFLYSYSGDVSMVSETVLTSLSGTVGATGPAGTATLSITVDKPVQSIMVYSNGSFIETSGVLADGQITVWEGNTDVTSSATIASAGVVSCTGTVNTATDTPVTGAKGYFRITDLTADTGSLQFEATYGGNTAYASATFNKNYVGYEIVSSLPVTGLFQGRIVFLTGDSKLYRYTGSAWTRAVDGGDITADTIWGNAIRAGQITAAQMNVTSLSSMSANIGTVTAGVLQNASGGARFDLNNARILFNTAPGTTGGYVRVQGIGFGAGPYLDWYGPKPAGTSTDAAIIAGLTDANAIWYLKTNGESLFGGSLPTFSATTSPTALSSTGVSGFRSYGTVTATPSGGKSPYTYTWYTSELALDSGTGAAKVYLTNQTTATVTVSGDADNNVITGNLHCEVRDANGRIAKRIVAIYAQHGAPD